VTAAFLDGDLYWELPGVWLLDADPHRSECRSCHAPVLWAKHAQSGKRAPFDPLPKADTSGATVSANHFATCPDAARWRKR
jgi:hypothetical protein